ncbi:CHAD domain-containing protein [Chitinophaga tropicalis]|uniref:CHAD domain-containing protein n=1 Tax=Chitinophaga tropicalis TaxID=2683588 RepID=A0A7K1U0B4_9BACT|nr:CHAD domain-containing protein [Chitinophaga tropicalis]MVT07808.1 CHAD domain-containing protein [Chitinophaga tropicalis]
MLKRKRQRQYLLKRQLDIQHQLHDFAESGSQEALHKLRVEVKKIKAVIKLYKGRKTAIELKSVREMFHHAGMIREAGINLQIVKQFHISYPAFTANAKRIIQKESERFRLDMAHYDKQIRSMIKSLTKLLHPIRNSDINDWVTRQLRKIAAIVTTSSTNKFHSARKRIKNLIYVHGIFHKRLAAVLPLNIDYLGQMQDVIGRWHDTEVAVELLGAHPSANIGKLQKEKDKAENAIHTISDRFWSKVFNVS